MPDLRQRFRSLHTRLFPPLEIPPRPVIRLTRKNRAVLLVLLTGSPRIYGYSLCRAAGTGSGTVYPLLARLEAAGWISSEWGARVYAGGPRRRLYAITPKGRTEAFRLFGLEAPCDR